MHDLMMHEHECEVFKIILYLRPNEGSMTWNKELGIPI
jgi:hypothetical protein